MIKKMSLWLLAVALILGIAVLVQFARLGAHSRTGTGPGLTAGRLTRCPSSPNCVCSEYADDESHYADAIPLPSEAEPNLMAHVAGVIEAMGGTVVSNDSVYLASTFRSRAFGFIDDFEVRLDAEARVLHFRSASRVGYGDLGVNAERVSRFKQLLSESLATREPPV
jgi:uncharacterized protein (DUF1499 family)